MYCAKSAAYIVSLNLKNTQWMTHMYIGDENEDELG